MKNNVINVFKQIDILWNFGKDHKSVGFDSTSNKFILFDMGFFEPSVMKFGTGIRFNVFYTMVTKSLWRHHYYLIMTSLPVF